MYILRTRGEYIWVILALSLEIATSLKLQNFITKLQAIKLNARLHAFAWQRRHGVRVIME
jgi:hypothetical protein